MLSGEQSHDIAAILRLVAPPASLALFFLGGFVLYMIRTKMTGAWDKEMRARGATAILGPFVRDYFVWLMNPILRLLLATGMGANAVTTMALMFAVCARVALALGHFALGGWLFLGSGFLDFFDGRIARMTNQSSRSGALLDSVFDRYAEGAVFIGLAWFYRESWTLFVVLGAGLGSQLVSYTRAACGNMNVDVSRVGVLQRPERITILGVTMCLSPLVEALLARPVQPTYHLAITGLAFVAVMSNITALQRLVRGMKALREHEEKTEEQHASEASRLRDARVH